MDNSLQRGRHDGGRNSFTGDVRNYDADPVFKCHCVVEVSANRKTRNALRVNLRIGKQWQRHGHQATVNLRGNRKLLARLPGFVLGLGK